ncbi:alpha/beta fold hydrolase [Candidatus Woesearchaeota archaeon]|nr:alpha/beta fold hydrolase [Candidatus Woesearchaeota archaeon]
MKIIKTLLLTIILLVIIGCTVQEGDNMKTINLKTKDNVNLVADYYKGNDKGIVLLHMLGKNKESWFNFSKELNEKGYSVIVLDLRGHGKSELNYKDFSEKDFNNMIYDAKAGKEYLGLNKVAVIGASIGANTALKVADEFSTGVLLSPGLNFRGIDITNAKSSKPILIVASEDDKYSADTSKEIKNNLKNSKLEVYKNKGHGTNMLDEETKELIFGWLDENL